METSLSQYKIFYAVANARSLSKAARELFISQPAISKAIAKLEESLQTPLFIRNARGVELTDEGSLLYRYIDEAFSSIQQGEQQLRKAKKLYIGKLTIGTSNTLCRHILLPYLKNFTAMYLHIRVNILSQSSDQSLHMLENGLLDLALLDLGLTELKRKHPSLSSLPIMEVHDIWAASPEYLRHFRLRQEKEANLMEEGNLMLLDRSNTTRRHVDAWLAALHLVPSHILEATTMDLLISFAKIGLGIACVIREFILALLQK